MAPPTRKTAGLTLPTLLVFQELLQGISLNVAAPDFEEKALSVMAAKKEVAAALEAADAE